MHSISKERVLAHWQVLCQLPQWGIESLRVRFLKEQMPLTASLLPPLGENEHLPEFDDPNADQYWRHTIEGALVYEIMIREAGHPLREITEQEVTAGTDEFLARLNQVVASDKGEDALLSDCPQRDLFSVVMAAHVAEPDHGKQWAIKAMALRVAVDCLHRACGEIPVASPRSWDAARVEVALAGQGDPLRREALSVCDAFRKELTPQFLQTLEWWAAEPRAAMTEDGSYGMHALFQLAKWREAAAWPVFRKLFSLPSDSSYDLLGDTITEDGSVLLAMVNGAHPGELRAMFEDESLDMFCRNACLDALNCLVAWNELPRDEQIAYLRQLLTGKLRIAPANEYAFAGVVAVACDLEAWELQPEIEAAFARGAVDESHIDLQFFRDAKSRHFGNQWEKFCAGHRPITDVAESTQWLDKPYEADLPAAPSDLGHMIADGAQPYIAPPKVGRNEPCPCGSGKKFKKCCGA